MNPFTAYRRNRAVQVECARCKTLVQEVQFWDDIRTGETRITALCHGEYEELGINYAEQGFRAIVKLTAFKGEPE